MRKMMILGALAATLALCAPASGATVVGVGEQSAGTVVKLHVGDLLSVSLGANLTTGYSWALGSVNRKVLRPGTSAYLRSTPVPGLLGSGGISVLTFTAAHTGRTPLRLDYVAPGRSGKVGKRYTLTVAVTR